MQRELSFTKLALPAKLCPSNSIFTSGFFCAFFNQSLLVFLREKYSFHSDLTASSHTLCIFPVSLPFVSKTALNLISIVYDSNFIISSMLQFVLNPFGLSEVGLAMKPASWSFLIMFFILSGDFCIFDAISSSV